MGAGSDDEPSDASRARPRRLHPTKGLWKEATGLVMRMAHTQAAKEHRINMKEGFRGKANLLGKCRFGMMIATMLR